MITKEQKQMWIDALRSEKYKQGNRCLRNISDEYCCLGVLGDVLGIKQIKEDNKYIFDFSHIPDTDIYYTKIGFSSKLLPTYIWNRCIRWNDKDKLNFNQIADELEKIDLDEHT